MEALVDFALREVGSEDTWLSVGAMEGGVEGVVVRLVAHHAGSLRILYHEGVVFEGRCGTRLALLVVMAGTGDLLGLDAQMIIAHHRSPVLLLE